MQHFSSRIGLFDSERVQTEGKKAATHIAVAGVDCYEDNGAGYKGTAHITRTGKMCQRWDSQVLPSKAYNLRSATQIVGNGTFDNEKKGLNPR